MISEVDVNDAKDWPKARILRTGMKYSPYRIERNEPEMLFGMHIKDRWVFEAFAQTLEEAEEAAEAVSSPVVKEYY